VCLFFLEKTKQGEADDKIIAVCADDPEYRHFNDIKELPPHRLAEIRRFFEDCILIIVTEFLFCSITFPVIHTLSL
jgi:inorganic pyrophosphatase